MENEIKITQKATVGDGTTQIGVQNNFLGITSEKASELAIKLFMENFPKLQEEARMVAKERAEELCKGIIEKLKEDGKTDFCEFADPDIQYVLNKSEQIYARFGTDRLYNLLRELIINRVNYNDDYYIKIILDDAINIAKSLSEADLNYISLIFLCKHTKIYSIDSIEKLEEHCNKICSQLPVPNDIIKRIPFLNMLRLLTISLGNAAEVYSRKYNFDIDKVKEILPLEMESIHGDYSLTPVGVIIAIININNKTNLKIELKEFI